jgi:hypothetical protein
LTIAVDDPVQAGEATIVLSELDHWQDEKGPSVERFGSDSMIGSLTGKITAGRFVVEHIFDARNVPKDAPKLKVRVDGSDRVIEFRIPQETNEAEGGQFEIGLSLLVKKKDGTSDEYDHPRPIFVRTLVADRPVVTFLVGSDGNSPNRFFETAGQYWRQHSDTLPVQRSTIESILRFLRTEVPRSLRDANGRMIRPWGEINIVSHGVDAADRTDGPGKLAFLNFGIFDRGDAFFRAGTLKQAQGDPRLVAPDQTFIDKDTIIVLRGCEIGDDQLLLDEFKKMFGGRARVFAPKLIQRYSSETRIVRPPRRRPQRTVITSESFQEYFWVEVPGVAAPRNALDLLVAKYGDTDPTREQFRQMLSRPAARHDSPSTFPFTGQRGLTFDQLEADARANFFKARNEENIYDLFDDWQPWTRSRARDGSPIITGHRFSVSVHRPLMQGDASATPSLLNPNHYGRSPGVVPPSKSKRTP